MVAFQYGCPREVRRIGPVREAALASPHLDSESHARPELDAKVRPRNKRSDHSDNRQCNEAL